MGSKKFLKMLIGPWESQDEAVLREKERQQEKARLLRDKLAGRIPTQSSTEWIPNIRTVEKRPNALLQYFAKKRK